MKASIGRLRRLTSHKVDAKDRGEVLGTAQIDELARAGKDMQDMRDRYDRLLSAAAATANNVYELSESFGEMGSCLEEIAPHNDEEIGRILVMLSKVQFDLQRVFDTYRSNIFKTITSPSESLINDLRTVEDMKEQCDEKRNVFERTLVKDKGKPKISKGERPIPPESRPAYKEFLDEATMCFFRLKSLKEGQARSLLTQAVRHHTAQMHLFHTVMKSLEGVEHHVRAAADKQHIDCTLSVHGNDEVETREDDDDQDIIREGELSFDYRSSEQRMDSTDLSFPRPSATRAPTVHVDHREEHRMSSYSAPLFPEKKLDLTERLRQTTQAAFPSSNAYVLPTPVDTRYSTFTKPASHASNLRPANHSAGHIWYSSPLEPIKSGKDAENNNLYAPLPRRPLTDTHQQRDATDASWVGQKVQFHRVIKNYLVQAGHSPSSIPVEEWTAKGKLRGRLHTSPKHEAFMLGTPKTKGNTKDFDLLITTAPIPDLNDQLIVFGRVLKGEDVVQEIEEVDTDEHYEPKSPIGIIGITLKRDV